MANALSLQVTLGAIDRLTAPILAAFNATRNLNAEIGHTDAAINQLNSHLGGLANANLSYNSQSVRDLRRQQQAVAKLKELYSSITPILQNNAKEILTGAINEAREYQTITEKFKQYGMGQAALEDAEKFAVANRIAGVSQKEMMTYFTEAQGVFRESGEHSTEKQLEAAKMAAPMLAKLNVASKGLDEHMQGLLHDQQMDMLRFAEQMGGAGSPERFNEVMNNGFKAIQSSGGNIDWSQYRQFIAKAGTGAYNLSNEALFAKLEPIIGEMKGGAAGDAVMTSYQRLNGIVKNKVVAHKMVDLGIWDKDRVIFNAMGGVEKIIGTTPMTKENSKILANDPIKFYQDVLLPKYKAAGIDADQIEVLNSQIYGRQGGKFINLIHKQQPLIEKSIASFDKARGLEESYNAVTQNYTGRMMELQAKWKNFELTLGRDAGLLDLATQGLEKLGDVVSWLTDSAKNHPTLTKFAVGAMVTVAGMGALSMLLSVLNPSFLLTIANVGRLAATSRLLAMQSRLTSAAIWLWNAALTANPIGLVVLAVAALAFAVYQYWEPIKAFTLGLWDGLKMGLAPVLEALAPLQPLFSLIGSAIGVVFNWLMQLFTPLSFTKSELAAAGEAGKQFGMALGAAITTVISVTVTLASALIAIGSAIGQGVTMGVQYLQQLHAQAVSLVSGFIEIGANIMTGLVNGIMSGYEKVKATITGVATEVKTTFQDALGIHSPSRVFEQYGIHVNEGLAVGLENRQRPLNETSNLAKEITNTFDKASPQLNVPAITNATAHAPKGQADDVMAYFMKQGWTKEQAAGIASNLHRESKFKANAVGDGGQAYGIGQWHPDRQRLFAKQFGHSIKGSSLDEQLAFVQWELTHNEKAAGNKLKGAKSARDAGAMVSRFYERPGKDEVARAREARERGGYADVLARKNIIPARDGLDDIKQSIVETGSLSSPDIPQSMPTQAQAQGGDTYYITIEVHPSQGMDEMKVAALVEQRFRERTRSKNGQMFDGNY